MRKYKLKKDFPSSKIGDVWVKADNGFMSPVGRESIKMHEHLFKPFTDWFEEYEDPKEYWCIDWTGGINHITVLEGTDEYEENKKQIGNYFETREDAVNALEKLEAFKRLKDKGFKFCGFAYTELCDYARVNIKATIINDSINEDLELLFGDK